MSDVPEELPEEIDTPLDDVSSPLKMFLVELHEVYQELVNVGFPSRIATSIVAHMLSDAMIDRGSLSDEDYSDDFEDDINDDKDIDDDERGTL